MTKTLIALAVLGVASSITHAAPTVNIYGIVDTGYIKQTGQDLTMGENINSRIGFRGTEDLGNGLKAIFQLEKRFNVHDGTNNTGKGSNARDWEGAANVGLSSQEWGTIRFGRVNELSTETIRKFDPFYQYGVGSMILSSQRSERIDNTARYDSPKWAGFSFGLSYSLGQNTQKGSTYQKLRAETAINAAGSNTAGQEGYIWKNYDNDGYAINLSYDNGPFTATANWSRVADSADSDVWNIGVAYKWNSVRISLLYEKTSDNGFRQGDYSVYTDKSFIPINDYGSQYTKCSLKSEQDLWLLGLEWDIGPGQFDASIQRGSIDDVRFLNGERAGGYGNNARDTGIVESGSFKDSDIMKYAVGYTYNLSKRTSLYGQVSYTDYDTKEAGFYYTGIARDSITGVQIGMTHRF